MDGIHGLFIEDRFMSPGQFELMADLVAGLLRGETGHVIAESHPLV